MEAFGSLRSITALIKRIAKEISTIEIVTIVKKKNLQYTNLCLMLLNCGVGEDSWESLGLQGDPTSPFQRRSVLGVLWKEWCWSWKSNTLATSCERLTNLKRPWCWGRLRAGGEGDDRRWDGWVASPTQWTWVWVNCGSWWWTGRPGELQSIGLQRVGHDWVTELNWMFIFVSDPLEEEIAIHFSKFAWKIPWIEEPGRL